MNYSVQFSIILYNLYEKWELVTFLLHAFTTITGIADDEIMIRIDKDRLIIEKTLFQNPVILTSITYAFFMDLHRCYFKFVQINVNRCLKITGKWNCAQLK